MNRWKIPMLSLLALGALGVWYGIFSKSQGELEVAFLNVGQGDAIFIETPSGTQVLIDGGAGARVLGELAAVMPLYDRSIDVVIATHTDADHIGGLPEVLRRYDVGMVIDNGMTADTKVWRDFDALIEDEGSLRHAAVAGERLMLGGGAHLDILGPASGERDDPAAKPNEVMVVARLVYGAESVLLAGDIERNDEIRLVRSGADLKSDILKVAHHGSKTSSMSSLLDKIRPKIAVISVGESNRYGHPHREALDRIAKTGARILRTDTNGRVCLKTSGASWREC